MSRPAHVAGDDTKGTVYRLWKGSSCQDIRTLTLARCWQIERSEQTMQHSEKDGASWALFLYCSLFSNNTVSFERIYCISDRRMNEYGALGKWHWQRESKVQREKPVPLSLCPPQIPYGLARDWTWPPRKQKGWWFTVSWHGLNRVSLHKVRAKSCACHKGIWGMVV
jgi:hypothetical protein